MKISPEKLSNKFLKQKYAAYFPTYERLKKLQQLGDKEAEILLLREQLRKGLQHPLQNINFTIKAFRKLSYPLEQKTPSIHTKLTGPKQLSNLLKKILEEWNINKFQGLLLKKNYAMIFLQEGPLFSYVKIIPEKNLDQLQKQNLDHLLKPFLQNHTYIKF